jgi:hypothetical protein
VCERERERKELTLLSICKPKPAADIFNNVADSLLEPCLKL